MAGAVPVKEMTFVLPPVVPSHETLVVWVAPETAQSAPFTVAHAPRMLVAVFCVVVVTLPFVPSVKLVPFVMFKPEPLVRVSRPRPTFNDPPVKAAEALGVNVLPPALTAVATRRWALAVAPPTPFTVSVPPLNPKPVALLRMSFAAAPAWLKSRVKLPWLTLVAPA